MARRARKRHLIQQTYDMKLSQIYKKLPGKDQRALREEARLHRASVIKESGAPQTGAYFWIPKPDGTWLLDVYFDSEFPDTMHSTMWWKYVIDRLGHYWNIDSESLRSRIGNNYAGIPRGRVTKGQRGYMVLHGNDAPKKSGGLRKIIGAFNLYQLWLNKQVRVLFDEHETMIREDQLKLQRALNKKLSLPKPKPVFIDDDWD